MSSAYRLTVKFAPSGAAYFNDKTQKWETSKWGHVWLEARKPNESLDEKPSFSSGWSTGRSTETAKDNISPDDWKNYRSSKGNLISSITVDITKDQFDKIQNYENAVREEKIPGFGKNYHAVWDSCIDFSGKGLGFIGLADKDFDGTALEWDRPDRQIKPFLDQIVKHKSKDASVTVSFRGKDYTLGHNESVDKFWDRIAPFWYLENMTVQENGQQNNQYSQLHSLKIEDMPQYAQNIYHQGKECFVDFCRHENIPYREEDLDRIGMSMAAAGYAQGLRGVSLIDVDERTREISIAHESPDLNEAVVNMDKAAVTPTAESLNQIQQTAQQFEYETQQRQLAQSQSRGMMIS
jgi:putative RTX toxins and related ca2+-binding protein